MFRFCVIGIITLSIPKFILGTQATHNMYDAY